MPSWRVRFRFEYWYHITSSVTPVFKIYLTTVIFKLWCQTALNPFFRFQVNNIRSGSRNQSIKEMAAWIKFRILCCWVTSQRRQSNRAHVIRSNSTSPNAKSRTAWNSNSKLEWRMLLSPCFYLLSQRCPNHYFGLLNRVTTPAS